MDIATLEAEAARVVFPRFTEETALALGQTLVALGTERRHPIVIDIRTSDRTLFHAALPGAAPLNDKWAWRKSNTALMFQMASMLVGARNRAKEQTLARDGLESTHYADNGGAVPVRVTGVGVVAVATVSGLPQAEDHALVVEAMEALIARMA
jgi:uncharacterized protein (UPF0303 family)